MVTNYIFSLILLASVSFGLGQYCTKEKCSDYPDSLSITSTIKLHDGVNMPLFGLGLWLSTPGGEAEEATYLALKAGYRLLDTAQIYGNEEDVGRGFRKSGVPREEVFVVSKVYTDAHGYEATRASVHASLQRLQMDYVDLFLIHSPFGGQNVDTYKALLDLKKEGFIRSVGVSNFEVQHLEGLKKSGLPAPSVNQIELHIFQRREYLVDYCRNNDIAIMGYSPLARGFLLDDPEIVQVAQKYKKTAAQIMIRWSVQKGYITIPKSVKEGRIVENSQVFDFTLEGEDMNILDHKEQYVYGWDSSGYEWDE